MLSLFPVILSTRYWLLLVASFVQYSRSFFHSSVQHNVLFCLATYSSHPATSCRSTDCHQAMSIRKFTAFQDTPSSERLRTNSLRPFKYIYTVLDTGERAVKSVKLFLLLNFNHRLGPKRQARDFPNQKIKDEDPLPKALRPKSRTGSIRSVQGRLIKGQNEPP